MKHPLDIHDKAGQIVLTEKNTFTYTPSRSKIEINRGNIPLNSYKASVFSKGFRHPFVACEGSFESLLHPLFYFSAYAHGCCEF